MIKLAVPFEMKNEVKNIGAKWDQIEKAWMMDISAATSMKQNFSGLTSQPNKLIKNVVLYGLPSCCWKCGESYIHMAISTSGGYYYGNNFQNKTNHFNYAFSFAQLHVHNEKHYWSLVNKI